jgi:hypothetical protein
MTASESDINAVQRTDDDFALPVRFGQLNGAGCC